jgi:hypothetical protein
MSSRVNLFTSGHRCMTMSIIKPMPVPSGARRRDRLTICELTLILDLPIREWESRTDQNLMGIRFILTKGGISNDETI